MSYTNEIWLAIRSDGDSTDPSNPYGDGSPGNPYAVNTPESFANIMRDWVPTNAFIRLLPGVYRTRGVPITGFAREGIPIEKIWTPKSGQKIAGSGIFSTFLQFVWDFTPPAANFGYNAGQRAAMVANDSSTYLNSFEMSDLTLDCNLPHATDPFPEMVDS